MFLSELQSKDIINLNDGKKVGKIVDANIDSTGKINYLVILEKRSIFNFFHHSEEKKIKFDEISKIGEDVILINM